MRQVASSNSLRGSNQKKRKILICKVSLSPAVPSNGKRFRCPARLRGPTLAKCDLIAERGLIMAFSGDSALVLHMVTGAVKDTAKFVCRGSCSIPQSLQITIIKSERESYFYQGLEFICQDLYIWRPLQKKCLCRRFSKHFNGLNAEFAKVLPPGLVVCDQTTHPGIFAPR